MSAPEPTATLVVRRARGALAVVAARVPELAALARRARIVASGAIPTAAVTARGRVALNPRWASELDDGDLVFVVAHELMHLLLRSHDRAGDGWGQRAFNVAHDAVINDLLRERLGRAPPAGGIDLPGAAELSAEALARRVDPDADDPLADDVLDPRRERVLLERDHGAGRGARGGWERATVRVGGETVDDALARKLEAALGWSRLVTPERSRRRRAVPALGAVVEAGGAAGLAPRRTWARASRRGEGRPGRAREDAPIALLLDTSSSMTIGLDDALAVARWIADAAPGGARVVQCDGRVRDDRALGSGDEPLPIAGGGDLEVVVSPDPCEGCGVRHAYPVNGAVTDLGPGLDLLAREESDVVVLTDGRVAPPRLRGPRASITWVLVGDDGETPRLPGRVVDLREGGAHSRE